MNQRFSFWKDFNWPIGLFIIGYHVALLVGLPIYFWFETPSAALIADLRPRATSPIDCCSRYGGRR